jgi:hypothetical protein
MSATFNTTEQTWSGVTREGVPFAAFLSEPDPSAEVLQGWIQSGGFYGVLHISDAHFGFPPQKFTVSSQGTKVRIESHPTDSWPQVLIVLSRIVYAKPIVDQFLMRPSGNTVEADLLYTRVLYTLGEIGSCFLASGVTPDNKVLGMGFGFEGLIEEEMKVVLHRARLARKLRFIENMFRVKFTQPEDVTAEQVRRIETLFRGITEGEFTIRGRAITVPVSTTEINPSSPPFSGIGPYRHYLGAGEVVLDYPKLLDIGPTYFMLDTAMVASQRVLTPPRDGKNALIRFEVLDNRITYRFEKYAKREGHKRAQLKLNQFYSQLLQEESPGMADTLLEPMIEDVPSKEATEIAVGWLEINDFHDRFSPQEPILDEERGRWRVPVYVVYAGGEGAPVGELQIDLKTGSIVDEPSAEAMYHEGMAKAENILRVG